jgi:hypothetical protein
VVVPHGAGGGRRAHDIFYTLVQATMYILCFRALAVARTQGGNEFLRSCNWMRVLCSGLRPLRHCVGSVAIEFVKVLSGLELVPAKVSKPLLPKRVAAEPSASASASATAGRPPAPGYGRGGQEPPTKRVRMASSPGGGGAEGGGDGEEEEDASAAVLHAAFPFDPYRLRRSRSFVEPIYLAWAKPHRNSKSARRRSARRRGSARGGEEEDDAHSVSSGGGSDDEGAGSGGRTSSTDEDSAASDSDDGASGSERSSARSIRGHGGRRRDQRTRALSIDVLMQEMSCSQDSDGADSQHSLDKRGSSPGALSSASSYASPHLTWRSGPRSGSIDVLDGLALDDSDGASFDAIVESGVVRGGGVGGARGIGALGSVLAATARSEKKDPRRKEMPVLALVQMAAAAAGAAAAGSGGER